MSGAETLILETRNWIRTIIIGQNFCPFAKREYDLDRIHYAVVEDADFESQLEHLITECHALDADPNRETSLLIFPNGLSDFGVYLDLLNFAAGLLDIQGYEGTYQLASFHPGYLFAGVDADDASHFTNRSPYPTIHILREASVEAVLKTYPQPENIPRRNIARARKLGRVAMTNLLANCEVT